MQDMRHMLMADKTCSSLEMVLDQFTTLRHLLLDSVSMDLLYLVAGKLSALETLCVTALCSGESREHP